MFGRTGIDGVQSGNTNAWHDRRQGKTTKTWRKKKNGVVQLRFLRIAVRRRHIRAEVLRAQRRICDDQLSDGGFASAQG